MNREQRRRMRKKNKGRDLGDPAQAQEILDSLSVDELVAGINNSIEILQKRGVLIVDWDDRNRGLYKLKWFGKIVCFLAAEPEENSG